MTPALPALNRRSAPLSALRQRALEAMKQRGALAVRVGERDVFRQDVEASDECAAAVLRKLNEGGS